VQIISMLAVSRSSKTGFVPRCKVCALLTRKAYYQANAESEKQRHAEWVEANKERVSKLNARSRAKHLDKRKEYEGGGGSGTGRESWQKTALAKLQ
jgi:hypothetical protein